MKKKPENIDYLKVENQIGCGWCAFEKRCPIRTSNTNRAKMGCPKFVHFSDPKYVMFSKDPFNKKLIFAEQEKAELKEWEKQRTHLPF